MTARERTWAGINWGSTWSRRIWRGLQSITLNWEEPTYQGVKPE